jgi:hypothetical protein
MYVNIVRFSSVHIVYSSYPLYSLLHFTNPLPDARTRAHTATSLPDGEASSPPTNPSHTRLCLRPADTATLLVFVHLLAVPLLALSQQTALCERVVKKARGLCA